MAFTQRLIESVMQTGRFRTSGYQDDTEINRNLAMVENDLMETLAPLSEENQKVRDLLLPFITAPSTIPVINGVATLPGDYVQVVDSFYKNKPVYKRNVNEVSIINTSPIRKPTLDKGPYYCYFAGSGMRVLPEEMESVDMIYIRRPEPGQIEFTIEETEESDYVNISVIRETEWPERAFNLLYFLMLEKYGVEMTSQISMEYSQMGVNKEIAKV